MTRRTGTFLSLAALIAVVHAAMAEPRSQQPSPAATPRPSRTMREMVMMPVVYRVPGMDNAITFANHPSGVHGFDNQNDDNRSREIIRSVLAFMKSHLGVAGA